jgi:hypothetical protein
MNPASGMSTKKVKLNQRIRRTKLCNLLGTAFRALEVLLTVAAAIAQDVRIPSVDRVMGNHPEDDAVGVSAAPDPAWHCRCSPVICLPTIYSAQTEQDRTTQVCSYEAFVPDLDAIEPAFRDGSLTTYIHPYIHTHKVIAVFKIPRQFNE